MRVGQWLNMSTYYFITLHVNNRLDWNAKLIDILGPEYGFIDEYRTQEATLKGTAVSTH